MSKQKNRDTELKEEVLNSSDKRMALGEKPGPIKSTAEVRRTAKKKTPQPIKDKPSEKNKK